MYLRYQNTFTKEYPMQYLKIDRRTYDTSLLCNVLFECQVLPDRTMSPGEDKYHNGIIITHLTPV